MRIPLILALKRLLKCATSLEKQFEGIGVVLREGCRWRRDRRPDQRRPRGTIGKIQLGDLLVESMANRSSSPPMKRSETHEGKRRSGDLQLSASSGE